MSSEKSSSNEMAEDRTDWAEDRTLMANERTFAAWMRTGMAAVALGVGLHAVFGKAETPWLSKGTATLFILIGVWVFYIAQRQSRRALARLESHSAETVSGDPMKWIAFALGITACAVIVILWRI